MEQGFNSDVVYAGASFHVQTEDWGVDNPYVVSRVYKDGAVVKSVKTPYSEILGFGRIHRRQVNRQDIRRAVEEQHRKILDLLLSGELF